MGVDIGMELRFYDLSGEESWTNPPNLPDLKFGLDRRPAKAEPDICVVARGGLQPSYPFAADP